LWRRTSSSSDLHLHSVETMGFEPTTPRLQSSTEGVHRVTLSVPEPARVGPSSRLSPQVSRGTSVRWVPSCGRMGPLWLRSRLRRSSRMEPSDPLRLVRGSSWRQSTLARTGPVEASRHATGRARTNADSDAKVVAKKRRPSDLGHPVERQVRPSGRPTGRRPGSTVGPCLGQASS